jgi:hypothetical protein
MTNVKVRLGIVTGDIETERLVDLRSHPDVEWVEVDTLRRRG